MDLADLFTSAGINIGLAILFFSLFSVFSKQPGNAGVYFTRDLLREKENVRPDKERRTLDSFIPSVGWLVRAWRATEDDILESAGLDAVVFLRIFVFSIRLFAICSAIGLLLVPVTFTDQNDEDQDWAEQDFDRFSISNVTTGSNRFWFHFGAIYVISFVVYIMLYMEYKTITRKRLKYLFEARPQPDQFSALVLAIPKDPDGKSYNEHVEAFFSRYHSLTYLSHQMVFSASKVETMILKLDKLKKEIDGLRQKPAEERKSRREGFCGLYGQKVDPVDTKTKQLKDLYQKIRDSQHEIVHDHKEIPAAIVCFKSRWGAAVAAQSLQAENPLTWVTTWAPEPRDVYWPNLSMPSAQAWLRQITAGVVVFLITIFYCIPSAFIVAINSVHDLEKIPGIPSFVTMILELPGMEEFVGGYLSTLLLAGLLYMVPPTLLYLSRLEGHPSVSTQERMACKKYFYFLAGPIFFIQVLGGGAVGVASEWDFIKNPAEIPYRLAAHIPGQATFFMSYIMTTGWAGFPLEILNFGTLLLNFFKRHAIKDNGSLPELEVYSFAYHRIIPNVLLFIFVGIIYSAIAPLLTAFLLVYFTLGYIIFKNQILHVYEPAYQTAGQYWPLVHSRIIAGLAIMQITFVGIFEAKMSTKVSLLTVPLPIITLIVHQYCQHRFFPVFNNYAVESTKKKDTEDERQGLQDEVLDSLPGAYLPPGLNPVDISDYGNPETDPLLPVESLP